CADQHTGASDKTRPEGNPPASSNTHHGPEEGYAAAGRLSSEEATTAGNAGHGVSGPKAYHHARRHRRRAQSVRDGWPPNAGRQPIGSRSNRIAGKVVRRAVLEVVDRRREVEEKIGIYPWRDASLKGYAVDRDAVDDERHDVRFLSLDLGDFPHDTRGER